MVIRINGNDQQIDKPVNLLEFIRGKGLVPEHIIVEHNSRIVLKDEWREVEIEENDNIEIVSFVGGG